VASWELDGRTHWGAWRWANHLSAAALWFTADIAHTAAGTSSERRSTPVAPAADPVAGLFDRAVGVVAS